MGGRNMNARAKSILFWTPRVLTVLFAVFISIFALDVFGEGYGFWGTLFALMMHLIPTALVLLTLALAWRWEWIGTVTFNALGVLYIVTMWGRFPLSVYFTIAGPLFVIGALFFMSWISRTRRVATL
jgi:hypothetical protein